MIPIFYAPGSTDYMNAVLARRDDFDAFSKKLDRDWHLRKLLNGIRTIKLTLRGGRS